MRIWDIHPGYLNRQSLLGEHRELHGMVIIHTKNKQGYSRHPETLRWKGFGWALRQRHRLLVAEMQYRGYVDSSPVLTRSNLHNWPADFIDSPARQFELLRKKYIDREAGRIPLPQSAQQLWAQHKYSVMAHDPARYRQLGPLVAANASRHFFETLALELTDILRQRPSTGNIRNALLHMWGHVNHDAHVLASEIVTRPNQELLLEIQQQVKLTAEAYLLTSTALTELATWLKK